MFFLFDNFPTICWILSNKGLLQCRFIKSAIGLKKLTNNIHSSSFEIKLQRSFFRDIGYRTIGASLKQKTLIWPAPFKKYFSKPASDKTRRNFGNADKASLLKYASSARHLNFLDLVTKIQPLVLFAYIRPERNLVT